MSTDKLIKELRMRAQELGYEGRNTPHHPGNLLSEAADLIETQIKEIKKLDERITNYGWDLSPDRMGR